MNLIKNEFRPYFNQISTYEFLLKLIIIFNENLPFFKYQYTLNLEIELL